MRRRTNLRTKTWIALITGLLLASAGISQQAADDSRSWRDEIGPNDVRVLGTIAEVRDETFELRAHDALYIFEIPTDPDQAADVRTGNEVQVWYDPEGYEKDGDTYYRVSGMTIGIGELADADSQALTRSEESSEQASTEPTETQSTESESIADASATAESQSLDAQARTDASVDADGEQVAEVTRSEGTQPTSESGETTSSQQEESSVSEPTESDSQEQALPQTAGSLPLMALAGLIALFSAVALRRYAS